MTKLILVRHSAPEIDPSVPSSRWLLSEVGRLRCYALAQTLTEHEPDVIVASTEPKANETAQIIARLLGKPCEVVEGLHEHSRENADYLNRDAFEARVAELFDKPNILVFGQETADQAYQRFAGAVDRLLEHHAGKNIAIVTHGTVLTLFVSRAVGLEPFPFWKRLGLPGFAVLSIPELHLLSVQVV